MKRYSVLATAAFTLSMAFTATGFTVAQATPSPGAPECSTPDTVIIQASHGAPICKYVITSVGSTSWTVPTGVSHLSVIVIGGGGGGGGAQNVSGDAISGGGGGGGRGVALPDYLVTPGESFSLVVGDGGTGGTAGHRGGTGGTSSITSTAGSPTSSAVVAEGGSGGGSSSELPYGYSAGVTNGGGGLPGNASNPTTSTSNSSWYGGAGSWQAGTYTTNAAGGGAGSTMSGSGGNNTTASGTQAGSGGSGGVPLGRSNTRGTYANACYSTCPGFIQVDTTISAGFSGGGGGGALTAAATNTSTGGSGGGGVGAFVTSAVGGTNTSAVAGTTNTGGGGGGGAGSSGAIQNGAAGGSGLIIIYWQVPLTITGLDVTYGGSAGGTVVHVTGTGFYNAAMNFTMKFSNGTVSNFQINTFTVVSGTEIDFTTPVLYPYLVPTMPVNFDYTITYVNEGFPLSPQLDQSVTLSNAFAYATAHTLSSYTASSPSASMLTGSAITPYQFTTNAFPVPTFTVASGSLPTGLSLSSSGQLTGTPTAAGTYTFTISANQSSTSTTLSSTSITINVSVPVAPTNTAAATLTGSSTIIGATLSTSNGTWTGTPTPTTSIAWYACTAQVTTAQSSIPVGCTVIPFATGSNFNLTNSQVGSYVAAAITASNGVSPAGISMTASTTSAVSAPVAISASSLSGLTAPVTGATPVTSLSNSQYTAGVTWSPAASTFAPATAYTATVTLTPASGYTLTGITANQFMVSGATSSTNSANSGSVSVHFPATAQAVISNSSLSGLNAPVTGATPVTVITNAQFTATVSWSPSASTFDPAVSYTATVTITPASGYTLTGVAANFFTALGSTSATNSANAGVVTVVYPATAQGLPSSPALTGLTAPVLGATPVTSITGSHVTGTVTWSPAATTFAPGTTYTATITLTPAAGYTLTGVAANYFTVAGASSVSNSANSGTVTAVFPATALTPVSATAVTGVTAPVTGGIPVTTISNGQFTGTVTWSPSASTFDPGVVYTATITLTPASGYSFTGVSANAFSVAGSTSATNSANSGVITAVFPATPAAPVSAPALTGLTAPVANATPVTSFTTGQFSGSVSWSPNTTTFLPGTVYTATVTLTPLTGYGFTGVPANFFTAAGTSFTTNLANSNTVIAVFHATAGTAPSIVQFSLGSGAGSVQTQIITAGHSFTLPAASSVSPPPGLIFAGWKVGTKIYPGGARITPHGPLNVVANWIAPRFRTVLLPFMSQTFMPTADLTTQVWNLAQTITNAVNGGAQVTSITIVSGTDSSGSTALNTALSKARANAIRLMLMSYMKGKVSSRVYNLLTNLSVNSQVLKSDRSTVVTVNFSTTAG